MLQHSVIITREEKRRRGKKKKRHKRPSWLVPLHQPSVFPLTHGTQMKTDFKGEDEKHSLFKAKCFTMGPCANTVVLSEKWTTVELTNKSPLRCASHTAREQSRTRLSKEALHFKNCLCGLVICICICKFHITNHDTPKNPTLLKHMRAFKRLDTQTIHFIVASKSQRTPPKDRELFDNVYNRHPKAAEVHQMLRQDGARRSPPGRMRSGTRSGFWKLKATKGQQRFWYTCWALRNWTPA